ncbi:putative glycerate 3-kinase [Helianthus debilis subsp. tardiflorus]
MLFKMQTAYNGRGDRAVPSVWPEVEGPLTVVLFEGWMLGFKHVPSEAIKVADQQVRPLRSHIIYFLTLALCRHMVTFHLVNRSNSGGYFECHGG